MYNCTYTTMSFIQVSLSSSMVECKLVGLKDLQHRKWPLSCRGRNRHVAKTQRRTLMLGKKAASHFSRASMTVVGESSQSFYLTHGAQTQPSFRIGQAVFSRKTPSSQRLSRGQWIFQSSSQGGDMPTRRPAQCPAGTDHPGHGASSQGRANFEKTILILVASFENCIRLSEKHC